MRIKRSAELPQLSDALAPWLLEGVPLDELSARGRWDFLALESGAPEGFWDSLRDAVLARRVAIGPDIAHRVGDWKFFSTALRPAALCTAETQS